MNIRRTNTTLKLLFLLITISTGLHAITPGEALLRNEKLLKKRIQNMNTIYEPFYNDEVKKRLGFMLKTKKAYTEPMLGRMVQYYPFIDSLLQANNLPTDLKYLTVIESSLKPDIHSYAGAGGLWQFMSATGELYGLRVNWAVDERLDPFLATKAAIKYLEHLHNIYSDWSLVLMAYNCGPGRINRAIKNAGGTSYEEIAPYLPKETRNYIPKFTAAAFFMKNYREFGYTPFETPLDLQFISRKRIFREMRFHEICSGTGIEKELLDKLNPSLKKQYIPNSENGYFLTFPSHYEENIDSFLAHFGDKPLDKKPIDVQSLSPQTAEEAKIDTVEKNPYISFTYTVKTGDSWRSLGKVFEINYFRLKYWNNYYEQYLYPRQKLRVHLPRNYKNLYKVDLLKQKSFGRLDNSDYLSRYNIEMTGYQAFYVPSVNMSDTTERISLDEVASDIQKGRTVQKFNY